MFYTNAKHSVDGCKHNEHITLHLYFSEYLMEEVYRMTYNSLYLFQKTLAETGQTVLAKAVPVEVRELPLVEQNEERVQVYNIL